jgi:putative ABC transport system permease protein
LIAVFTLALGIGANTAIFGIINGVLLRPLAFHDPKGLFMVFPSLASPI